VKAKPITLPLMINCSGALVESPSLKAGNDRNAVQAQLSAVGGGIYVLPLTVEAAEGLLQALATMLQVRRNWEGPEPQDPPTLQ
jgi:hypothetical protein